VRFENLRELSPALGSIVEAKNPIPAASNKLKAGLCSTEESKVDALPGGTTTNSPGSRARTARNGQNGVIGFFSTAFPEVK
jgi:hypothetical protein